MPWMRSKMSMIGLVVIPSKVCSKLVFGNVQIIGYTKV